MGAGVEEWMAFFRDPDANLLAIMAQVPPVRPLRPARAGPPEPAGPAPA